MKIKILISSMLFILMLGLNAKVYAMSLTIEQSLIVRTGLMWLSPMESLNITYNEMTNYLQEEKSEYYGLRFATITELDDLMFSYNFGSGIDNQPYFDDVFNDFGFVESGDRFLGGFTQDDWQYGGTLSYVIYDFGLYPHIWQFQKDERNPSVGSWLVKDITPVPEPSTIFMVSSGVFAIWRRCRKDSFT